MMNGLRYENGNLWRIGGASTAIFSALVGALLLVTPIACTFVGGLQLLFLVFLFLVGVIALAVGLIVARRHKKVKLSG